MCAFGDQLDGLYDTWLPQREALKEQDLHEDIRIRIHRSMSWLKRVPALREAEDADAVVLYAWIAINALYASWSQDGAATEDWRLRHEFVKAMVKLDTKSRIKELLQPGLRSVCESILGNQFLHQSFWRDPTAQSGQRARSSVRRVWPKIHRDDTVHEVVNQLLDRLSLLRNQLCHGQSTYGGSANRTIIKPASEVLPKLAMTLLQIIILDDGWKQEQLWKPVPYPPVESRYRVDR